MIAFLVFCLLRIFGWVISWMPYAMIHALGRILGIVIYYVHVPFRKKTMTNLAIAFGKTMSERERRKLAKRSFQNLTITSLEFFRLQKSKNRLEEIATIEGGLEVMELLKKGQGVVFVTGHQANWEIPFIAITEKAKGMGIGRPIKNRWLYKWILSIREMHGGKIVTPKNALSQGLKALRNGEFVGIVGDQAFPESSYSYPLFGTRAWTTTAPALLAYKTNSPLVIAFTKRVKGRYHISASPIMWPNCANSLKEEIIHLMDTAMGYLEKSIAARPHEWMWQHDRWKQQGIDHVKREYRYGFILIIFPQDCTAHLELLPLFRLIYPRSFLSFLVPVGTTLDLASTEVYHYTSESDLLLNDWRYQLVIDFYDSKKARRHYQKRGAFKTLTLKKMQRLAQEETELKNILKKSIVKAECLSTVTI